MQCAKDRTGDVVILTVAQHYHAALVHAALRRLDVQAHLISHASLPRHDDLVIGGEWDDSLIRVGEPIFRPSGVRAFCNRRPPLAFNLPERLHPADRTHVAVSWTSVISGLSVLLDDCFAVNRQAAARCGANKLNQLKAARRAGLSLPAILVSSDLDEVRAFAATVPDICMKPLSVYSWRQDRTVVRTLTRRIDGLSCLNRERVALMPVIWQAFVSKAFEVRLVVFGDTFIGTRIEQPAGGEGIQDWRANNGYLHSLSAISAPDAVQRGCRAVLDSLDIRFGAFDFIVPPSGEWVFMEVNPAGQFIWQEEFHAPNRLIEPFSRYLASQDERFTWNPETASDELSFGSLVSEVESYADHREWASEASPNHDAHYVNENDLEAGRAVS